MTRLNTIALDEYSQRYADAICNQHFENNPSVKADDLYEITPVPQVNLLVVYELYEKWRENMKTFRSEYFDFENADVNEGLAYFMNLVSQHIAIKRPTFEKLVQKSTKDTLRLLYVPQDYFQEVLRESPDLLVTKDRLEQLKKYTHNNRFIPTALADRLGDADSVYATEAINWLEEIVAEKADLLENPATTTEIFSKTVLFDEKEIVKRLRKPETSFFDSAADRILAAVGSQQQVLESQQQVVESQKVGEVLESQKVEEVLEIPKVEEVLEFPKVEEVLESRKVEEVLEIPKVEEVLESQKVEEVVEAPKVADNQPVVEEIKVEPVAEVVLPSKANGIRTGLASIAQGVPLHQKFLFIQELFGGSPSQYDAVVNELDNSPNYDAARELINYKYASKYLWDMSSDTVAELIELVKRRFQ